MFVGFFVFVLEISFGGCWVCFCVWYYEVGVCSLEYFVCFVVVFIVCVVFLGLWRFLSFVDFWIWFFGLEV